MEKFCRHEIFANTHLRDNHCYTVCAHARQSHASVCNPQIISLIHYTGAPADIRLRIFLTTNIFPPTVPVKRPGLTFLEGNSTLSQLHPSGILPPASSPGSFLPPPTLTSRVLPSLIFRTLPSLIPRILPPPSS